jgi:hypothetical protein
MSRPISSKTLREVVGDRKARATVLSGEAAARHQRSSPARCSNSDSPRALPPLPGFMSCPKLLDECCVSSTTRSNGGEESDFSSAVSVLSGRSTVLLSSAASTPNASRAQSPITRRWWSNEATSDVDSNRDDDTMSIASSASSVSTCSDYSVKIATRQRLLPRPHTAVARSSTGSMPSALERDAQSLCCTVPSALGTGHLQMRGKIPLEFESIFSKARNGRYKEVGEIIDAGAPIDGTDSNGNTPLHAACQGGSLKTVKALLRRGCETNAQNRQGNTPLHYACAYKYQEVAEYLVRKGDASPDMRNIYGLCACEGLGNKTALERTSAPDIRSSFDSTGDRSFT